MGRRDPVHPVAASAGDNVERPSLSPRALWALIVAGFVVRLVLACTTWGTGDTISYLHFAHSIDQLGLLPSYAADPLLNHPPLPALASWVALLIARHNAFAFAAVFRIPVVVADFGSALLLRKIMLGRGFSPRAALVTTAFFAWNPCALLVSGYHCNTDPVVAMLSLFAVYLLQDRRSPLLGGLVLGLAINVKLIPILLIVPLGLACRSRRELVALLGGLAVMSIPYFPPLLLEPAFARNVLGYKSSPDPWGILLLLRLAFPQGISPQGVVVAPGHPALLYNRIGAWIVLACSVAWGVIARRSGRFDRYQIAAVMYALLLVLAPGFGVQYLALLAPLLYAATSRRFANVYGAVGGMFLVAAYYFYWDGGFPLSSLFQRPFTDSLAEIGLIPWCLLIYFLIFVAPRGTASETVSPAQAV